MKFSFVVVFLLSLLSASAQDKKDVIVKTEASEVTVFINGAQVSRKTFVTLPTGKSTLRFVNLSPYIDHRSIQAKIDGEVTILSVNHELNYNDTVKISAEAENLRSQIEEIAEQIDILSDDGRVIAEEIDFLRANIRIGGQQGVDFNNLKSTSTYFGERLSALTAKGHEINKKIKKLQAEKNVLEKKKNAFGDVKPEPTGEIVVAADVKTAARMPVELSYYVANANWFPAYDIRVQSVSEPVQLAYKANIMQNTKEEWKNVKLRVSSANPNQGNTAPQLKTYFLDYYSSTPRYDFAGSSSDGDKVRIHIVDADDQDLAGALVQVVGTTRGASADDQGYVELSDIKPNTRLKASYLGKQDREFTCLAGHTTTIVLEDQNNTSEEVQIVGFGRQKRQSIVSSIAPIDMSKLIGRMAGNIAGIRENTTSVEFEIKTPYTIPSQNKTTTVEMERYEIPASYEYFTIPKADRDAFLIAHISDWEQYSLLEGEANIIFENTFIGKTTLDVHYLTDTLDVSLGRDRGIIVQREKVKENTKKRLLGSKTETVRDWKITVRNNKRQPTTITVLDQIPVSTNSEIEVETVDYSGGLLNKETGEVRWKLTLNPSEKKELKLQYKVKYPKDKNLTVE